MKFEFCRRVDMTTNELVIVVSIGDEKYYLTNEAYSHHPSDVAIVSNPNSKTIEWIKKVGTKL